jgi:glycerate kinase
MKKCILIPDSFKGTMSSQEVCSLMSNAINTYYKDVQIVSIPVADGGEGTVDSFLASVGGEKVFVEVSGPYFNKMKSFYGIIDGTTAIIEMASCAGLPLVGEDLRPHKSTTFGVGELMIDAAKKGCKKIVVGLGGSATNDGGVGAAAAAGVTFFDNDGKSFVPTGENLDKIKRIDTSTKNPVLEGVEIVTMCDIDNPLYGPTGASFVFGPQKGADEQMVEFLDQQLKAFAATVQENLQIDIASLPGSGAAGGMGGGMVAFFQSSLEMGIEVVLDTVHFDEELDDTDIVFTGEGKIDFQSLRGKVVIGIARRTKKKNVPLVAIVGDIGDNLEAAYQEGLSAIFSINRVAKDFSKIKHRAKDDMALTMDNLIRFVQRLGF